MSFPKAYADRVAKLRVPFGFVMVAAFVWLSRPDVGSLEIGVPVAFAGLALRAWAAGHLEKNKNLTWSGPYAHVRNPLYLGTLTVAAGFAIASRRWELGLLFAAVFGLVYLPVVELEEQHLQKLFPTFGEFAGRVPKLVPRLTAAEGAAPKHFAWNLYRYNREYEALGGFAVGVAILFYKAYLLNR